MQSPTPHGTKSLLIGNADIPIPELDMGEYSYISVFNRSRHPEYYPICTHHWMRAGIGNRYAADPDWLIHNGRVCILDHYTLNHGRLIYEKAKELGRSIRTMDARVIGDKHGYPKEKVPSTGWIAVWWFLDFGIPVDIVGFTFEGVKAHNWEFEESNIKTLVETGRVCIKR